jgi:hypothetical protein
VRKPFNLIVFCLSGFALGQKYKIKYISNPYGGTKDIQVKSANSKVNQKGCVFKNVHPSDALIEIKVGKQLD